MSVESRLALTVPWFLKPVPAFALVQTIPVWVWLLTPDRMFAVVLQGHQRAHLGIASVLAFGTLVLAFVLGALLGERLSPNALGLGTTSFRPFMKGGHYVALALAAFSTSYVALLVLKSGINIVTVILASQANVFKEAVYGSGVASQVLIMGRHLVLSALITWFGLGLGGCPRPRTLPVILASWVVLFVFTSSRLTVEGVLLVALLFWSATRGREGRESRGSGYVRPLLALSSGLLVFAVGVWIRTLGTWAPAAGGSALRSAGYEALAYVVSPVNYSVAFVEEGTAFVRGLGLSSFFGVVYTVFKLPVDATYREAISWYYYPSLNQIGLLGEWFTIVGPLLWIPALVYGLLAGATYVRFRRNTVEGVLLYPLVVISLFDSIRGFLLSQNILAANVLFSLAVAVMARALSVSAARRPPDTSRG